MTTTEREVLQERLTRILPLYHVIVLDCDCHSYQDVIIALCKTIPGMSAMTAFNHAWRVDHEGSSIVHTCPLEPAELYRDQLLSFGLRVTLEAAT